MWRLTVSCLSLLGYSVCSIIPRHETQGTSVLLACSIASIEGKSVEWRGPYQENTLYAESNYSNTNLPDDLHDRIFVTGDHGNGHYNLRIVNAQISDEGLYRCSVQNGDIIRIFNLTFPALLTSTDASYNRYILIDSEMQKLFCRTNRIIDFQPEQDKLDYCVLSNSRTPYCQNHIRFITKKSTDKLILCGTNANSAKGYELNVTDMTYSSSVVPCSNDPFDNFTALYAKSPNGGEIMYYASTSHTESTIQRPIPGTTDYMKGVISEKWMKDPQFVGSFDVDDRVFIFFRETAVETDPDEKKIYSRVAKVCKHDIGGNSLLRNKWTSYQKARLDCVIPGHIAKDIPVRFDSIQDVTMKENVFYGVFITTTGTPASAICAFNLTSIDAALDGSFIEQTSANEFWKEATTVLTPRPGQCTNDSMSLSESVLQFIADHPLMHMTVQPMYGKPIFVMDDEELQQLELHNNMTEIVFYAASNTGKVYKLFFKNGNTYTTSTYEPLSTSEVIWTLKQYDDNVYIGTDFSVRRLRVINCEKHKWINECVKDPHCGWVNKTDLLPQNENQHNNMCRTIEYIKDNNFQTVNDVYTHESYDISITTPKSCPPDKPQYLRVSNTTEDKLQLRWIPGFDGGHVQTFIIEYRNEKTDPWTIKTVDSIISNYDPQIYELSGLQSAILFEIRLCAKNKIGTSPNTESITVSTSNSGSTMASMKTDRDESYDQTVGLIVLSILLPIAILTTFILTKRQCTVNIYRSSITFRTMHEIIDIRSQDFDIQEANMKNSKPPTTKEIREKKLKRRKRQNDRTNLTSQSTGAANVQYLDTRKVSPTLDLPQPDNGWFPSSSTPEIFQTDKSKICE